MAFSYVFGSNAIDVSLLLVADVLYTGGTVMTEENTSLMLVAALGAAMTCVYLWGLLERENRSVLGVGSDSAVVAVAYVGGMGALYFL